MTINFFYLGILKFFDSIIDSYQKRHRFVPRFKNLIFIDVETSGVNLEIDEVIEIAWVVCDRKGTVIEKNSFIVKKSKSFVNHARHINHISPAMIQKGEDVTNVLHEFNEVLQIYPNSIVLAHSCDFDLDFIRKQFKDADMHLFDVLVKDTVDIFKRLFRNRKSCSLDSLRETYGITSKKNHRALKDAHDLATIFYKVKESENLKFKQMLRLSYNRRTNQGILEQFIYFLKRERNKIIANVLPAAKSVSFKYISRGVSYVRGLYLSNDNRSVILKIKGKERLYLFDRLRNLNTN